MKDHSDESFGEDPGLDPNWAQDLFDQLQQGHEGQCPYPCPFCMGAGLLKQMRPEVADHLVTAGRELLMAAKAMLDSVAESREGPAGPEKIPLD